MPTHGSVNVALFALTVQVFLLRHAALTTDAELAPLHVPVENEGHAPLGLP